MIEEAAPPHSSGLSDAGDAPVFVVGAPGSGSETVYAGLAAHPELWAGDGTGDFLAPLLVGLPAIHGAGTAQGRLSWLSAHRVSEAELARSLGQGIAGLVAGRAGTRRWVDHSPVYARMLGRLGAMFPGASVVFVNRDGRDAVAEMTARTGVDHVTACRIWTRYADAWRRAGDSGLALIEVRHERLAAEPATQLDRVLDFLGELPHPAAAAAAERALAGRPAPAWPDWPAPTRAAFAAEAGPALVALGYAAATSWVDQELG